MKKRLSVENTLGLLFLHYYKILKKKGERK